MNKLQRLYRIVTLPIVLAKTLYWAFYHIEEIGELAEEAHECDECDLDSDRVDGGFCEYHRSVAENLGGPY